MMEEYNGALYKMRRAEIARRVGHSVLLLGAFDPAAGSFAQESSFYYFTGLQEGGLACLIDAQGHSTLFVPQYPAMRTQWVESDLAADTKTAQKYGFDTVTLLGETTPSFHIDFFSPIECWKQLATHLLTRAERGEKIGTVLHNQFLYRLFLDFPALKSACVEVFKQIGALRRKKDAEEAELLLEAAKVSVFAHMAVLESVFEEEATEFSVQRAFRSFVADAGAEEAYAPIIAAGANGTMVHHRTSERLLIGDDLVMIDAGVKVGGYCSDITRTYPLSGEFTEKQAKFYQIVLDVQRQIAEMIKPGEFFLRNDQDQEHSLYHQTKRLFAVHKLDQYFLHGVGHFIGLDVHDAGDVNEPLGPGDWFTLEPALYMPKEQIGIRIEDVYAITPEGEIVCITDALPREIAEIEEGIADLLCDEDGDEDDDECDGSCSCCDG